MEISNIINEEIQTFYNESLDSEVEKLRNYGYEVVDRYDLNNYSVLLLKIEDTDFYEVSLTSNDEEFTTYNSQITKPTKVDNRTILETYRKIMSKVKQWLNKYSMLHVGSFNQKRTDKYHRLFRGFGFKVTPIFHNPAGSVFPENWMFQIRS